MMTYTQEPSYYKADRRKAREAAAWAYAHREHTYADLWEAYAAPSIAKQRAWRGCVSLCEALGGYDILISARNTMQFSVVFRYPGPGGRECVAYITKGGERFAYADTDAAA